ncbi:MAG TPA: LysR substrate-binding domain-containing protein [Ideonella sp.]|uniref:LysR family transcriptional regulator n=1 Tax=Ideonella sp. TaxID=1929293 RepID=UPI002B6B5192|nr:LysR substrate-binding domain-containing protein [Ideonella sp.]HSI50577.1 LysR substrate-binding domain-containing protein [Ideonella sp.]
MDFKQLEYFVAVAEHRSFSRAAVSLDIAQSALSRQVRLLEVELRETLLSRNGRGVTLTEAGERLFQHSVGLLQQLAAARADLGAQRDEPVGRITIALPPSMGRQLTLPLIDAFQRQLPRARLAIVEGLSSHIAEWIVSGRVDLGLVYNPEPQPELEFEPLLSEPLGLVSPAAGQPRRSTPRSLPLAELPQFPLVLPERAHVIRRLLETQTLLAGLKLQVAWEVSSVAALIDLVCAGYGHAVLTPSAVVASGRGDLLSVRPLTPLLNSVLCLATSAHKRPSALTRQARQVLAQLVSGLPQAAAAGSLPG